MTPSDWMHLAESTITALVLGGACYGAIRTDLKNITEHINLLRHSTEQAHTRISEHVENFHAK